MAKDLDPSVSDESSVSSIKVIGRSKDRTAELEANAEKAENAKSLYTAKTTPQKEMLNKYMPPLSSADAIEQQVDAPAPKVKKTKAKVDATAKGSGVKVKAKSPKAKATTEANSPKVKVKAKGDTAVMAWERKIPADPKIRRPSAARLTVEKTKAALLAKDARRNAALLAKDARRKVSSLAKDARRKVSSLAKEKKEKIDVDRTEKAHTKTQQGRDKKQKVNEKIIKKESEKFENKLAAGEKKLQKTQGRAKAYTDEANKITERMEAEKERVEAAKVAAKIGKFSTRSAKEVEKTHQNEIEPLLSNVISRIESHKQNINWLKNSDEYTDEEMKGLLEASYMHNIKDKQIGAEKLMKNASAKMNIGGEPPSKEAEEYLQAFQDEDKAKTDLAIQDGPH